MGNIHTKKRNGLDPQRVRDMAAVGMAIERQYRDERPKGGKRKFGEDDNQLNQDIAEEAEVDEEVPETGVVEQGLMEATEQVADAADEDDTPPEDLEDKLNKLNIGSPVEIDDLFDFNKIQSPPWSTINKAARCGLERERQRMEVIYDREQKSGNVAANEEELSDLDMQ